MPSRSDRVILLGEGQISDDQISGSHRVAGNIAPAHPRGDYFQGMRVREYRANSQPFNRLNQARRCNAESHQLNDLPWLSRLTLNGLSGGLSGPSSKASASVPAALSSAPAVNPAVELHHHGPDAKAD